MSPWKVPRKNDEKLSVNQSSREVQLIFLLLQHSRQFLRPVSDEAAVGDVDSRVCRRRARDHVRQFLSKIKPAQSINQMRERFLFNTTHR